MNIDVKNSLDKLLLLCGNVQANDGRTFRDVLSKDIFSFVFSISREAGCDRFNYFSKLYLNGDYKAEDYSVISEPDIPETLELLCLADSKTNTTLKTSKLLVAFFTTLGRHYMTSPQDKNSIDKSCFMEQIQLMNAYADNNVASCSEVKEKATNQSGETGTSAMDERQVKADGKESNETEDEPEESLEELLERLDSLIGLEGVKSEVNGIINMIKVKKKREELGVKQPPLSLHLVFYGNPGTGKTTVARLLAKIYKNLGVLSGGQLVEVDRGGLVAGYIGQTATKTQEVINKAMGGVLFIDEAYSLTHGKGETDFGQEAVDTILKAMEDHRDDFVVIVAGYPGLMEEFISSNPGLKSRFNQYINFSDYTAEELYEIFCLYCKQQDLQFDEECADYLKSHFQGMVDNKKADFANGRDVRNFFENAIRAQSDRLAAGNLDNMTREEVQTILISDLKEAACSTKSF